MPGIAGSAMIFFAAQRAQQSAATKIRPNQFSGSYKIKQNSYIKVNNVYQNKFKNIILTFFIYCCCCFSFNTKRLGWVFVNDAVAVAMIPWFSSIATKIPFSKNGTLQNCTQQKILILQQKKIKLFKLIIIFVVTTVFA